jgi:hypothetical protein
MNNDEIRVKIAKLHGANWWELDDKAFLCNPQHAAWLPKGAKMVDSPAQDSIRYYRVRNWPEDIDAAEKLLNEMIASGMYPDIKYAYDWDRSLGKFWFFYPELNHAASAQHPILATCISLAWINWKESQK